LSDILSKLHLLGYQLKVAGEQVRVRWRGECPPPQAIVFPLFAEAQRRQADILAAFAKPAGPVDGEDASAWTGAGRPNLTSAERQATGAQARRAPARAAV
jgi:hypothetical protein